jgi:Flp pilus assembly protein TadB
MYNGGKKRGKGGEGLSVKAFRTLMLVCIAILLYIAGLLFDGHAAGLSIVLVFAGMTLLPRVPLSDQVSMILSTQQRE